MHFKCNSGSYVLGMPSEHKPEDAEPSSSNSQAPMGRKLMSHAFGCSCEEHSDPAPSIGEANSAPGKRRRILSKTSSSTPAPVGGNPQATPAPVGGNPQAAAGTTNKEIREENVMTGLAESVEQSRLEKAA